MSDRALQHSPCLRGFEPDQPLKDPGTRLGRSRRQEAFEHGRCQIWEEVDQGGDSLLVALLTPSLFLEAGQGLVGSSQ